MSGPLGLSIGTTNLVAARVGNQPVSRRSVLTLSTDRTPQVGVPESGHGVALSGFVERVGDPVPLVAPDGASYRADTLLVEALDAMVEIAGGPSEQLAIAVPAHWGAPTLRALRNALRTNPSLSRGGMPARLIPDAVASLTALRANPGLPPGGVVALLDFGGGGTSITLADAASALEPLDETTRYPEFSGDLIDQALLTHVLDGVAQAGGIDPAGTTAVASLTRLREECRQAKERLSADTATDLAVELPGYSATVRVTRTELESLMQAPLAGVLDALEKALERNGISWSAISAVVTIGGGASIPLVTQQLSEHSRAAVVTTPQPALDAAIGAALSAAHVDSDAQTGMAPTLGVAAAAPTAGIASGAADSMGEGSSTFRALAWSEDDADDDVVPYTGPDVLDSYGSETAARPAVQYVPPTGPIEQPRGGWQRLPLTVFAVAAALVLVAIGGVTYALTSATGTAPSSGVTTTEPKPLPQEPVPSSVAPAPPPPPAEPPPAPAPETQAPAPPPVTVTQAPPPPVTETRVVTQTTTPPPTTTTTTTTPPPTTTTTTPPPTTTTTYPTPTTTTTNPMTTTYVTVPFVPVPIPIQVPNRGETQNPYQQQQPQYPYQQQQPQYPYQPYP